MKKKIFLADDSITIQKVVELTFSEENYEVVCVSNGAAAMQRIGEASPDIALLDVIMPDRSGYEICAHTKKDKDLAWMPVLLLTGAFEPYDENRASEVGADGHMTKPFESRALVTKVEALLAAHPRPGMAAGQAVSQSSMAASPEIAPAASMAQAANIAPVAHTVRMKAADLFAQVPAGPAMAPASPRPAPQAAAPVAPDPNGGPARVQVPPELVEKAVREAIADITEKIIREVAWEVIPDLAEAIIRRRIRELEAEAER
ncbi:MAG TPA: response regulator [Patescibacteria group bacterium]|nr:response regulator [Patescibacteria group bacterium]